MAHQKKALLKEIIVVAPHPDDETLGCAGTLLKHKAKGDKINWLLVTDMHEKHGYKKEAVLKREKEIKSVAKAYGFDKVCRLGIPAAKVDNIDVDVLVKKIAKFFNEIKPNIVYLPFRSDVHSDHRVIFEAAYSCVKTFRFPFIKKIIMMEVISETEFAPALKDAFFIPNYFVDISAFLKKKIEIMKIYKGELAMHPFPRSVKNIKALAVSRGSAIGVKHAEAFMILKEIWNTNE